MKKINARYKVVFASVVLLFALGLAATAYAHGVVITYNLKTNGEVELQAEFDTGEQMAQAQVTVYSPEDPLTPWLTGVADDEGRYVFVIDPEMPGIWDVQYRKAGHGDIVYLQLEAGMVDPASMNQPPGPLQPETEAEITEANSQKATPAVEPDQVGVLSSGGNLGASGGFTSLQILLMSASVIWGFVGTALYFSAKRTQAQDHDHAHGHHH